MNSSVSPVCELEKHQCVNCPCVVVCYPCYVRAEEKNGCSEVPAAAAAVVAAAAAATAIVGEHSSSDLIVCVLCSAEEEGGKS